MENVTLNIEDIFEEIKEVAFAEGAFSRDEWTDIVDDILDSKRDSGEIHDDVDWEEIRAALVERFDQFENDIPVA